MEFSLKKITSGKLFLLINILLFQSVWWLLVLKGNSAIGIALVIIIFHLLLSPRKKADLLLVSILAPLGMLIDASLTSINIFSFEQIPYWLGCLWVMFALTFNHSLSPLCRAPVYIQALLGGIFGSISYYSGSLLNAVILPQNKTITLIVLFIVWLVLFPLQILISNAINNKLNLSKQKISDCQ